MGKKYKVKAEKGEVIRPLTFAMGDAVYGIGKKVANCVCLFGLHHIDAFPVDTWIQKILMEHYFDEKKYRRIPKSQLFDRIIEDSFGCYPGYAGVMQQYIFNYERNVIGKNQT